MGIFVKTIFPEGQAAEKPGLREGAWESVWRPRLDQHDHRPLDGRGLKTSGARRASGLETETGPQLPFYPQLPWDPRDLWGPEVSWAPTCHPTFTLPCPTYSLSNFPWSNTSDQIKADKSRKFKDQIKSWLALIRAGYHLIWKTKNGSLKKTFWRLITQGTRCWASTGRCYRAWPMARW